MLNGVREFVSWEWSKIKTFIGCSMGKRGKLRNISHENPSNPKKQSCKMCTSKIPVLRRLWTTFVGCPNFWNLIFHNPSTPQPFFKWQSDGVSSIKMGRLLVFLGAWFCRGDPCDWSSTIAWREFLEDLFAFYHWDFSQANHEFEIITTYIYSENNSNRTSCGPANAMSGICTHFPPLPTYSRTKKKLYWESLKG